MCEFDSRSVSCSRARFIYSHRAAVAQNSADLVVKIHNRRELSIPFSRDPKRPIKQLKLYAQHGSTEWKYQVSAVPSDRAFRFIAPEDGSYALAVQAEFLDGTTDRPVDQLVPQLRFIVDTAAPKIAVHAFAVGDLAGVEWDIIDENLDANSIRLEYRWPGMADWRPIDPGSSFAHAISVPGFSDPSSALRSV